MKDRMSALRGAVNFTSDTEEEISAKTVELMDALMRENSLSREDIVCIMFSLTEDITAIYPAAVFREKFFSEVPLFSSLEPKIKGAMQLTLRVMILHYGESNKPVYLYETKNLRKDIFYEHCD